ncbi:MAG: hypothetical protein R6U32_03275 [Candidatus Woesearchaeota archaeon]
MANIQPVQVRIQPIQPLRPHLKEVLDMDDRVVELYDHMNNIIMQIIIDNISSQSLSKA